MSRASGGSGGSPLRAGRASGGSGVAPPDGQSVGGIRSGAPGADQPPGGPDTGRVSGDSPVRDLLVSVAPPRLQAAAARLDAAELAMMERDDEPTQMRYAAALAEWGDAGGYDAEVLWDACCMAALGRAVTSAAAGGRSAPCPAASRNGWCSRPCCAVPHEVLLLDEPDNYLDVPGKRWLEQQLAVHTQDRAAGQPRPGAARQLRASASSPSRTAGSGCTAAVSPSYAQARRDRIDRLDELRRRWDEEHEKLKQLVRMYRQKASYNDAMASRLQAAETRLRRFEEAGPPELPPRDQNVRMRLRGGRTGKRAVICEKLELTGLMQPFDLEVWYGERVAVLGSNGSGKSLFLRLLGGDDVPHQGRGPAGRQGRRRPVRADPRPP